MYRHSFFIIGIFLSFLSLSMLIPAVVDLYLGNDDWLVFVIAASASCFVGGLLVFSCRSNAFSIGRREGYLITVASWFAVTAFGALPLAFSSLDISYTDAFFETASGLTTTGSTVLIGLDEMAPGLLLWRSIMQWIGGVGIIVMAIFMLPLLRVGGMQLFRSESSDISDKIAPKVYQIAGLTLLIYFALTFACMVVLMMAGMDLFDAINHAMATLATGGYSTKDASIGFYNSIPIEVTLIVFMTLGALPLMFYARLIKDGWNAVLRERQVPVFLAILCGAIFILTVWRHNSGDVPLATALREAAFNATSILTDTGFATTDFSTWGTGAQAVFLILMFIGGCAGSTSGAIKIFRWQILWQSFVVHLKEMVSPNRVLLVKYGDQPVDGKMIASVRNFFFMYIMTWALFSTFLMFNGLDILSSVSAVAQAMANAGPGLGPVVGPGTNFASINDSSKWALSLAMILGRLELTTFFVLLSPAYWQE